MTAAYAIHHISQRDFTSFKDTSRISKQHWASYNENSRQVQRPISILLVTILYLAKEFGDLRAIASNLEKNVNMQRKVIIR